MSTADGLASVTSLEEHRIGPTTRKELLGVLTLAGNLTLTDQHRNVLKINTGGANRDVVLGVTTERPGRMFRLINAAAGATNLVVKNSQGDTIVTINQNEQAEVWYDPDGTGDAADRWVLLCVQAIALS